MTVNTKGKGNSSGITFPLPKKGKDMKTKALTIALAAMMAAPTVTPILAEDIKSTTVNYSVAQEYQWTVPTDVTIPVANSVTVKDAVEVVKNTIPADSKLQITAKVNSADDLVLKNKSFSVHYLAYVGEEAAGDSLVDNSNVLEVYAGDTGKTSLTFKLNEQGNDNLGAAGTYSGTLGFTAEIVNQ